VTLGIINSHIVSIHKYHLILHSIFEYGKQKLKPNNLKEFVRQKAIESSMISITICWELVYFNNYILCILLFYFNFLFKKNILLLKEVVSFKKKYDNYYMSFYLNTCSFKKR